MNWLNIWFGMLIKDLWYIVYLNKSQLLNPVILVWSLIQQVAQWPNSMSNNYFEVCRRNCSTIKATKQIVMVAAYVCKPTVTHSCMAMRFKKLIYWYCGGIYMTIFSCKTEKFVFVLPICLHKYDKNAPENGDLKTKMSVETLKTGSWKNTCKQQWWIMRMKIETFSYVIQSCKLHLWSQKHFRTSQKWLHMCWTALLSLQWCVEAP